MKIAHVITRADVGGAQTYVLELAHAQLTAGHHVTILAGHLGMMADHARANGIEVAEVVSLRRDSNGASDLRALREIQRLLAAARPDVVHAHSSKAGVLTRVAARRLRLPTVYTAHGWPFQPAAGVLQRTVSRLGETASGHWWGDVICVSEAEAQLARRLRIARPQRIHVIPNGVPDTPHRRVPLSPESDVHLVMVARFGKPKDQPGVLAAVAQLPPTGWHLTFVGDGPGLAAATAAAVAHGLSERVTFAGARSDVDEFLATADVGLLWSEYEGMPLALMEAMRAGLACVANDLPGTRALFPDGTGLLVPKTTAALTQALAALLVDRAALEHLAVAARQRYEGHFTMAINERAVSDLYRQVMAR